MSGPPPPVAVDGRSPAAIDGDCERLGDHRPERAERQARRRRERSRAGQLHGRRPRHARSRLGRGRRTATDDGPAASPVPEGLLRPGLDLLQEPVPCIRRAEAGVPGRRLCFVRRLVLGASILAQDASELRRPAAQWARRVGASPLALVGTDCDAGSMDGLGLRRPLPPSVRAAHLRRTTRVRLLRDARRLASRQLRP